MLFQQNDHRAVPPSRLFCRRHPTERADLLPIQAEEQDDRHRQRGDLRDREGEPDGVDVPGKRQQVGHRKQHDQLARDGDDHAVDAVAESLEHAADDDARACEHEGEAHGAQRRVADGQHVRIGVEQAEQGLRDELEGRHADQHQRRCAEDTALQHAEDALRLPRAVVIGRNSQRGVVDAEHRHEDEALQLVVCAEDGRADLAEAHADVLKAHEHEIHAVVHHGADGDHDHGRHADGQNAADELPVRAEAAQMQADVRIFAVVEDHGQNKRHDLAEHRGHGCTGDLHARQAEQAEDEDGVKNDVQDRAGALRDEGVDRAARGLQQALKDDLAEDAERGDRDDADIGRAVGNDGFVRRLGAHEELCAENAEQSAEQHAQPGKKDAVQGRAVHHVRIAFAERARQQGIDADGRARCDADHDVLHREGQRNGVECVLINVRNFRDKGAVDHVVKRLHQHGQGHRQRHGQQQPPNGHRAHFVFLQTTHCFLSPNHSHAVYIIEETGKECKQTVKKSAQPKVSEGLFHQAVQGPAAACGGLSKEPAICTKIRNPSTFSRALCYTGRKHVPAFPGPRGGTPYDDRSAQRPACAGPRRGAGA